MSRLKMIFLDPIWATRIPTKEKALIISRVCSFDLIVIKLRTYVDIVKLPTKFKDKLCVTDKKMARLSFKWYVLWLSTYISKTSG